MLSWLAPEKKTGDSRRRAEYQRMNTDVDVAVLAGFHSRMDLHAREFHWCPPLVSADDDCRLMTSPFWRYRGPLSPSTANFYQRYS